MHLIAVVDVCVVCVCVACKLTNQSIHHKCMVNEILGLLHASYF